MWKYFRKIHNGVSSYFQIPVYVHCRCTFCQPVLNSGTVKSGEVVLNKQASKLDGVHLWQTAGWFSCSKTAIYPSACFKKWMKTGQLYAFSQKKSRHPWKNAWFVNKGFIERYSNMFVHTGKWITLLRNPTNRGRGESWMGFEEKTAQPLVGMSKAWTKGPLGQS